MIQVSEQRLIELVEKEKKLEEILSKHPELLENKKPTSTAKKYKAALAKLLGDVEAVLSNESFKGIFQIAYIHGATYTGPNLAKSLAEARKALK